MAKTAQKVHLTVTAPNQHSIEGDFDADSTLKSILDDWACRGTGLHGHIPHHPGSGDAYPRGAGAGVEQLDQSLPISELPQQITLR